MKTNLQSIYELSPGEWWNDQSGPMAVLHWLTPTRFDYFHTVCGPLMGREVLDIGCGGGLLADRFARAGARVLAVDPLQACCRASQRHAAESGLVIQHARMRGEQLGLAASSFDVAVAADVLEHVSDLPGFLGEVGRVLRPGGVFLFDTINRTWLARLLLVWLGERVLRLVPRGTHDPDRFVRPAHLRSLLPAAGMHLQGISGMGPVGFWRGRVVFRQLPFTWLCYLGWAQKMPAHGDSS